MNSPDETFPLGISIQIQPDFGPVQTIFGYPCSPGADTQHPKRRWRPTIACPYKGPSHRSGVQRTNRLRTQCSFAFKKDLIDDYRYKRLDGELCLTGNDYFGRALWILH
ncbi:hypothetical protein EVAR_93855_1 [Eumeta japonica]|uniref:Uncharacterized protein n=1 Tax=Eumeta variegata TaxID=151549 RepID=A0A4C1TWM1_EUMVA|nr:hypothetical protein EVAR_93855_1 [Eumeta japonica]